MTDQIPVVDLELALSGRAPGGLLDAVRGAAEQIGVLQVVNHGVPGELLADYGARIGRLVSWRTRRGRPAAGPGGGW